jgi:hypothetical protein
LVNSADIEERMTNNRRSVRAKLRARHMIECTTMAKRKSAAKSTPIATPAATAFVATPAAKSVHEKETVAAEVIATNNQADTLWSDDGWTAKVIKNEEDDGWAVAMTLDGQSEPSLVGPWTMGRDKKNPKPLDANAFATLVKTASEIIRRHEQQTHAALHKSTKVASANGRIRVQLDITPDEDEPFAELSAFDDSGNELARVRVSANFNFNHDVASAWVVGGFAKLGKG